MPHRALALGPGCAGLARCHTRRSSCPEWGCFFEPSAPFRSLAPTLSSSRSLRPPSMSHRTLRVLGGCTAEHAGGSPDAAPATASPAVLLVGMPVGPGRGTHRSLERLAEGVGRAV